MRASITLSASWLSQVHLRTRSPPSGNRRLTPVVLRLETVLKPDDSLAYESFRSVSDGVATTIEMHSSPNSIGFNLLGDIVDGTPAFTKDYAGSATQYIQLYSVYMGCVTISPNDVYLPAWGAHQDQRRPGLLDAKLPVPIAPRCRRPPLRSGDASAEANLPSSFCSLSKVEFEAVSTGAAAELTTTSFDTYNPQVNLY